MLLADEISGKRIDLVILRSFEKKTKLNSIFNLKKNGVLKIDFREIFQNPWQIMIFNISEKQGVSYSITFMDYFCRQ